MSDNVSNKFSELRITQAYIKLLCLPENANGERLISLERIGACDIRMFDAPSGNSDDVALFWLELFDHDRRSSLDSCSCTTIVEAVVVFDDFAMEAGRMADSASQPAGGTPG